MLNTHLQRVEQYLKTLPSTEPELVQLLKDEKCQGRRNDPCGCPMAILLAKKLSRLFTVGCTLVREIDPLDNEYVTLPPTVRNLVKAVDSGTYPELEVSDAK
jgi:hypothetical protein